MNLRRIGAMLIAAFLLLGLCGCAAPEKALVGTWNCELDLTDYTVEQMGDVEGLPIDEISEKMILTFVLTIDGEKNYSFALDTEKTKASIDAFLGAFKDLMVEVVYAQGEAEGLDRDTMDATFKTTLGMTVAEYVAAAFAAADSEALLAEYDESMGGAIKVEGGKLYFLEAGETDGEDCCSYTIDGDTLVFDSISGNPLDIAEAIEEGMISLPLTFTKR